MSEVQVNGEAIKGAKRTTVGAKKPLQPVGKLTVQQVAQQVENAAGSLWEARLELGRKILLAAKNGITLLDLQKELRKAQYNKTHKVVSLADKNATGLSKLATVAAVMGSGIKSPDGKHSVTPEQIASWDLSAEKAYTLANRIKTGAVKVSTLKNADADAVSEIIKSTKPAKVQSNTTAIRHVPKPLLNKLKAAADAKGISVPELLAQLIK